jgi:lysyl-tRNA synthetase (EC 6.1.1.6)
MVVDEPDEDRIRLPYTFAAVLGMTDDPEIREEIARQEGHIPPDAPRSAVEQALTRVERASRWASRTGNAFDYELKRAEQPKVEFDRQTQRALDALAAVVAAGHDGDRIQEAVYETARDHGLEPADLFTAGYQLFFGDTQGPRLGPFLGRLDREFVVARLRRER